MEERRNILLRIALIMAIIVALFAFRLPPIDHSAGKAGGVYDGSGTELSPGTVHALPEVMTFTSEENAITVKATVKPDTIRNKSVDWIVDFENPAAAWAKGKTASDYVSVTPESDGAATAKVRCLKSFGERILIKVISRADPDVSAQCKVDYYGKADSVQLYFRLGNADEGNPQTFKFGGRATESGKLYNFENETSFIWSGEAPAAMYAPFADGDLLADVRYSGDYTKSDSFWYELTVSGTQEFINFAAKKSYTDIERKSVKIAADNSEIPLTDNMFSTFYTAAYSDEEMIQMIVAALEDWRSGISSIPFIKIELKCQGGFSALTFEAGLAFTDPTVFNLEIDPPIDRPES